MSQKSQFLGFEPFLEGSCGPQTENFGKCPKTYRDISLESPKKTHRAKFKQTSDWGVRPNYVKIDAQKTQISVTDDPRNGQKITFQTRMTLDT